MKEGWGNKKHERGPGSLSVSESDKWTKDKALLGLRGLQTVVFLARTMLSTREDTRKEEVQGFIDEIADMEYKLMLSRDTATVSRKEFNKLNARVTEFVRSEKNINPTPTEKIIDPILESERHKRELETLHHKYGYLVLAHLWAHEIYGRRCFDIMNKLRFLPPDALDRVFKAVHTSNVKSVFPSGPQAYIRSEAITLPGDLKNELDAELAQQASIAEARKREEEAALLEEKYKDLVLAHLRAHKFSGADCARIMQRLFPDSRAFHRSTLYKRARQLFPSGPDAYIRSEEIALPEDLQNKLDAELAQQVSIAEAGKREKEMVLLQKKYKKLVFAHLWAHNFRGDECATIIDKLFPDSRASRRNTLYKRAGQLFPLGPVAYIESQTIKLPDDVKVKLDTEIAEAGKREKRVVLLEEKYKDLVYAHLRAHKFTGADCERIMGRLFPATPAPSRSNLYRRFLRLGPLGPEMYIESQAIRLPEDLQRKLDVELVQAGIVRAKKPKIAPDKTFEAKKAERTQEKTAEAGKSKTPQEKLEAIIQTLVTGDYSHTTLLDGIKLPKNVYSGQDSLLTAVINISAIRYGTDRSKMTLLAKSQDKLAHLLKEELVKLERKEPSLLDPVVAKGYKEIRLIYRKTGRRASVERWPSPTNKLTSSDDKDRS